MMQAPDIATAANTDAAHTQLAIAAEIVIMSQHIISIAIITDSKPSEVRWSF